MILDKVKFIKKRKRLVLKLTSLRSSIHPSRDFQGMTHAKVKLSIINNRKKAFRPNEVRVSVKIKRDSILLKQDSIILGFVLEELQSFEGIEIEIFSVFFFFKNESALSHEIRERFLLSSITAPEEEVAPSIHWLDEFQFEDQVLIKGNGNGRHVSNISTPKAPAEMVKIGFLGANSLLIPEREGEPTGSLNGLSQVSGNSNLLESTVNESLAGRKNAARAEMKAFEGMFNRIQEEATADAIKEVENLKMTDRTTQVLQETLLECIFTILTNLLGLKIFRDEDIRQIVLKLFKKFYLM